MSNLPPKNPNWSIVYQRAYNDDGSLWYPERLNEDFLEATKRVQGTRIFANQYLNEIFPAEDAVFKEEWFRYYDTVPEGCNTFAFIDPAISTEDNADFTGISIVSVDHRKNWYVKVARRERLTPTQVVELVFDIQTFYKPLVIGIESVAFQKALLFMVHEEMQRRGQVVPVTPILHGNDRSKELRIQGALVARMEWGFIHFAKGEAMDHLKREMLQFPRAAHDDILDSLASCESIIVYPVTGKEANPYESTDPSHPDYERRLIESFIRKANESASNP